MSSPLSLEECVANACQEVPGLQQGALALLPEGLLIGGVGSGGTFEREPLVRSAARCLGSSTAGVMPFLEHLFVSSEQFVVILRGHRYPRLALALLCTTQSNPAFVMSSSRNALHLLEGTIDLGAWEL